MPRRISILGYVLAAVMIFRIRQIDRMGWVFLGFPLWILLLSIQILIVHYRHQSTESTSDR